MAMRTTFSRNSAAWRYSTDFSLVLQPPDVLRNGIGARLDAQNNVLNTQTSINGFGWELQTGADVQIDTNIPRLTLAPGTYIARKSGTRTSHSSIEYAAYCIIARAAGARFLCLSAGISAGIGGTAFFDLIDGTVAHVGKHPAMNMTLDAASATPLGDGWLELRLWNTANSSKFYLTPCDSYGGTYDKELTAVDDCAVDIAHAAVVTNPYAAPAVADGSALTVAADFFDAPSGQNEYGPGQHTWQCAVRMSRDSGEPTIIGHGDGRIYARDGRLYLDGPGELMQPERDFAPGDLVPFVWNVELPGATPDIALGRSIDDTNWWNGHLVDIVPYPRLLRADEIASHLERTS